MRTLTLIVAVAITSVGPLKASADVRSDRQAAAQQALLTWFECAECQDGELDRLLAYRDLVEAPLIATLQKGLSPARRATVEFQLRENHRSSPSQEISEDEYVELFRSNIENGYRARAAIALGALRTPGALEALKKAEQDKSLRADVRSTAKRARTAKPTRQVR